MRLLVTRPKSDAERTAATLRARGHHVAVAPLLRIEHISDAAIGAGPWAALLVTSANAAPAIVTHRRFQDIAALPVLAVGERSAEAMRGAGFAEVISASGDLRDLRRLAAQQVKPGEKLLYFAGADRSGDLAGELGGDGFAVHTAVVYRAVAAASLPPVAAQALADGIDGVLHFSRRSAEAYFNTTHAAGLAKPAIEQPVHFCLSAQIAESLMRAGADVIRVAPHPDEAALLALIPVE